MVSDDRHPNTLAQADYLDDILRQAVTLGLDPFMALRWLYAWLRLVTLDQVRRFGLAGPGAVALS